jgi:hypothetical protein
MQNLIEALAEPGEGDDALDEQMHAELARRGLTLETWAAQWQARAEAVIDQDRRARRARALGFGAAAALGLCAGAAATAAVLSTGPRAERLRGVDVQQAFAPIATQPDATQPDAGRSAPARR